MKNLIDLISRKGFVVGPFVKSAEPGMIEIAGHSGFDFVILDLEHGPASLQQIQHLVRAANVVDIIPVIRTRDRLPESISQALDIGAQAVQIPQLTTAQETLAAVQAAKFYPSGNRGVCRFVRAAGYSSMDRKSYFAEANRTQVIIQVEGVEALRNFDEILEVPGVDILFIGPYDLSQSMGVPGEIDHPEVVGTMRKLVNKANQAGKYIGIFTDTLANAKMWKDAGVHYISYSVDMGLYLSACQEVVLKINEAKIKRQKKDCV